MFICKWTLLGWMLLMGACTAHLQPIPVIKSSSEQSYWAKQSFYAGIFFDDDRYGFLSPIPFEKLTCLKSLSGDYIIPPASNELVVFGTRVTIQKIEWPTQLNTIRRPLLTPRHVPWIYMTVAQDRGSVTINRDKTYIMLVPEEIRSEEALFKWLSNYFSKEDNNLLFLNLSPSEIGRAHV